MVAFAVETELLTGGFGDSLVLREVSLRVPSGSVYGLLGPNGAGKTTLLRTLLGLLIPRSGEVSVLGKPLRSSLPRILSRIGSLIEQPSLYPHLTGRENLEIARKLKGVKRGAADAAVSEMGVSDFLDRRVKEYSRGMRQRLGIAIAALGAPDLLLLDEPMNGLDAAGLDCFRAFAGRQRERGATVVISSHQFAELERIVTDIGIMSQTGDLLFQGTREQLGERVPQELVIQTDRMQEAQQILESAGLQAVLRDEWLVIFGASSQTAIEANRLLTASGIGVYHLSVELATLEALFLKVTKNVKAWEAR